MKKKSAFQMGPYITPTLSVPVLHMDKRSTMPAHACIQQAPMVGKQAEVEVTSLLSSLKGNIFLNFKRELEK